MKVNGKITPDLLKKRADSCIAKGFSKQKWIIFCETLMHHGFELSLYEARQTVSKYITVSKNGLSFKVRFSNHKPAYGRQITSDCDFFVGRHHAGVHTTDEALVEVFKFFRVDDM